MAAVKGMMEGLLFGAKKEKPPAAPAPPPADVSHEAESKPMGIGDFAKTPGRLRGASGAAPTGLKTKLGPE